MKKRYLLFIAFMAVCAFSIGLVTFLNPVSAGGTAMAAAGTNPEIVAVAKSNDTNLQTQINNGTVKPADLGVLSVNGSSLIMDGNAEGVIRGNGQDEIISASAKQFYTVDRIAVFKKTKGAGDETYAAATPDFVFDDASTISGKLEEVTNTRYIVEVFFNLAEYNLNVTSEYHGERGTAVDAELTSMTTKTPLHPASEAAVKLGDTVTLENNIINYNNGTSGVRFVYAEILYRDSRGQERSYYLEPETFMTSSNDTADTYEITFDKDLLKYADGDDINIVGVYSKTVAVDVIFVDVSGNALASAPSLNTSIITPFTVAIGAETESASGDFAHRQLDVGTELIFTMPQNFEYITYKDIKQNGTALSYKIGENIVTVGESECLIEIVYEPRGYTVEIIGMDSKGHEVNIASSSVRIEGLTGNQIHLDDVITEIGFTGEIKTHKLSATVPFSIQRNSINPSSETTDPWNDVFAADSETYLNKEIDGTFLDTYLVNGNGGRIIRVVVNFDVLYALTFGTDNINYDNKYITVEKVLPGDETAAVNIITDYFTSGDVLRITVADRQYISFQDFSGIAGGERKEDSNGKLYAEVTISTTNRDIVLIFSPKLFEPSSDLASDGIVINGLSFKLDDTITMTYDNVPQNHEITSWTINDKSYADYGATLNKGTRTLSLKLTESVLNALVSGGKLNLNNKVSTGLQTGIIMAIVLPGLSIPVFAAVLVTFMIINHKRKKLIKEQLTQERSEKIKRNVGGYIEDLRQGNITGNISSDDVKKAMKERKKKD